MGLFLITCLDYSVPLHMRRCCCSVKVTNSEPQETVNTSVYNIQMPNTVLLDSLLND